MRLGKFVRAASALGYVRSLGALITKARQRVYASHIEKTQMRLAPVRLRRNRSKLYRGW
jgi:hypothetical protein